MTVESLNELSTTVRTFCKQYDALLKTNTEQKIILEKFNRLRIFCDYYLAFTEQYLLEEPEILLEIFSKDDSTVNNFLKKNYALLADCTQKLKISPFCDLYNLSNKLGQLIYPDWKLRSKIEELNFVCQTYEKHLYDMLYKQLLRLKEQYPQQYDDFSLEKFKQALTENDITRIKQIIETCYYHINILEDPSFQKFTAIFGKYIVVEHLRLQLSPTDTKNSPSQKIKNFEADLVHHRATLEEHLDAKVVRFLAAVAHILTFGLVYAWQNGCFGFKAAKGQVATEKMDLVIKQTHKQ